MDKRIHIVALDVPWPANYGGVIDIFYKLKYLSELGFQIQLHCFSKGRLPQAELEKYCPQVFYYPRSRFSLFSKLPHIVQSRASQKLIERLKKDDAPILMEGIHCSYPIWEPAFSNRKLIIRLHNTEYIYYSRLAKLEKNFFKKLYYQIEAGRLRKYEKSVVDKAKLLAINRQDEDFFREKYAATDIEYLPVFTPWTEVESVPGKGDYCLYHGNLSVNENEEMVIRLIEQVFSKTEVAFTIAGSGPSKRLVQLVARYSHIRIVAQPSLEEMDRLIREAHIHVLPSLNATGIKLKLLHAMYKGRHCIVNHATVEGTHLASACKVVENMNDMKMSIEKMMQQEFTETEKTERAVLLKQHYDSHASAEMLRDWLL